MSDYSGDYGVVFADFVDEVDTVRDRALFNAVFTERLWQCRDMVLGTLEWSCSRYSKREAFFLK